MSYICAVISSASNDGNVDAAVAIGNPSTTEGHVPKLQPSTELHEPSSKPKPPRAEKEKSNTQNEHKTALLFAGKLEESLGFDIVGCHYDRALHVEVLPVQAEKSFSCNGLLPSHG